MSVSKLNIGRQSNQHYEDNADGFTLGGGTTQRDLTVTGGDVTVTGSGSETYTFPLSGGTLALDSRIDDLPIPDWNYFEEKSSFTTSASSSQGVAYDGTHIYVTDNTSLYKYDSSGTLQTSRDISADGTLGHIGDLTYNADDGFLYVTANNYPTTSPYNGYVMKYNTSLAYQSEWDVADDFWAGSIAYKDSAFWLIDNVNSNVLEFNTSFVLQNTYSLDFTYSGTLGWQGIEWVGDSIFVNLHGGTTPKYIQQFYFDGSEFVFVRNIQRPKYTATQGLAWDSTDKRMYFATRDDTDEVIVTQGASTIFPKAKACRAYKSTEQTTFADQTWTTVNFESEDYDTEGWHSTSSNTSRITVDEDGLYHIYAQAPIGSSGGVATELQSRLIKNGSTVIAYQNQNGVNGIDEYPNATCTVYLSDGDYVEFELWHNKGDGTPSIDSDTSPQDAGGFFEVRKIAA